MRKSFYALLIIVLAAACQENATPKLDTQSPAEEVSLYDSLNIEIKKAPNNAELYFERAKLHYFDRDMASSLSDVGRALSLDSSMISSYLLLADLKLIGNQSREAKEALMQALEREPKNVSVLLKLGELYMLVEDYGNSFKYLNEALKEDVYNSKAYQMKGFSYKFLGDTVNAVSSFQTAVEQNPEDYDSYMQLGLLYSDADHEIALDYFNNALKARPQSVETLYAIGIFHQNHGNAREALKTYEFILELTPNYFNAWYNRGFIYMEMLEENDSAAQMFTQAIEKGPQGYFAAYHNRGLSYERANLPKKAEADYRKALEINPQYDLSARGLSRVLGN